MTAYTWTTTLKGLYEKSLSACRKGGKTPEAPFSAEELGTLSQLGLRPINLQDHAEDLLKYGEPSWDDFLLVASVRRDFFLYEQRGQWSRVAVSPKDLPAKTAKLEGIAWLPRILRKARCFLEGSLCNDIMYGCAGDRSFLKKHDIHQADFLRMTWAARGDDSRIVRRLAQGPGEGSPKH